MITKVLSAIAPITTLAATPRPTSFAGRLDAERARPQDTPPRFTRDLEQRARQVLAR